MTGQTRWTGRFCVAALAVALGLLPNWQARAENENFSNKPAPALFNADCTGAGCHKGPQGLGKGQSQSGLAGFLREHYTNSRESAAALAAYILKMPAGPAQPEPKPTRTSTPRGGEREPRGGSWFDPAPSGPAEARPGRQQQEKEKEKERERTRPSRSAAKPPAEAKPAEPKPEAKPAEAKPAETKPAEAKPAESEEPSSSAAAPAEPAAEPEAKPEPKPTDRRRRTAEPVEKPEPKPAPVPRNQRGRQPAVAATPAPAAAPAEHTPPPAPAAPPPPQYDIFD